MEKEIINWINYNDYSPYLLSRGLFFYAFFKKSFKKTIDIITHTLYNKGTSEEEVKYRERVN